MAYGSWVRASVLGFRVQVLWVQGLIEQNFWSIKASLPSCRSTTVQGIPALTIANPPLNFLGFTALNPNPIKAVQNSYRTLVEPLRKQNSLCGLVLRDISL